MTSYQNAVEYASDQMQQGKITASEANVLIVQIMGVRIVHNKLPKEVRTALNAAVKKGELGHIKKNGLKPEAYHHKNARGRALEEINREYREKIQGLKNVFA